MKILIINCGSSSIKYKLFVFPQRVLLKIGSLEKIGEKDSPIRTHSEGISKVLSALIESNVIANLKEIAAVGHRVVHGAESFQQPCFVNSAVIRKIKECVKLAPIHNPANLEGINAVSSHLPSVKQVAVFDTAFHQTLPKHAYLYALPQRLYRKHKVRKYGFHGTSHQYIALEAAKMLAKPLRKCRLIICHLGNGCSVSAVKNGKSIDTSMGFTPLEGLIMGTRTGDIDGAAILYLMEQEKLSLNEITSILNKESGLLGISELSNDIRTLKAAARKGHKNARLAIEMFLYRLLKYIGAYYMVLGGADAICFTAGIGENNPDLVRRVTRMMNPVLAPETKILVIRTDEEEMIAKLTYEMVKKYKNRRK